MTVSEALKSLGTTTLKKTDSVSVWLISGITMYIVNYYYPWLEGEKCFDQLRLAGKKDFTAMKLDAITGRGTKKDFIDLYFLLQEYNLKTIIDFYTQKFHDGPPFLVLISLSYFVDADLEQNPLLLQNICWPVIKKVIIQKLEQYLKDI